MTGEVLPHHARPWELCPHPERWGHYRGGQGVEVEVLELLEALVRAVKPACVLETGTGSGQSAIALARGCQRNGAGHVYTYEVDGEVARAAMVAIEGAGLTEWVTVFAGDLWKADWIGERIDLMFCDGGIPRALEVQRYARWMTVGAVVVAHDAVAPEHRWAELAGEFRRILLPTPVGLWIMQNPRAAWFGDRPSENPPPPGFAALVGLSEAVRHQLEKCPSQVVEALAEWDRVKAIT